VLRHRALQREAVADKRAGNEIVDHARRRIRAVDGRGAVAQDFHPLHQARGIVLMFTASEARRLPPSRSGAVPSATVEQRQCAARADAAQVDRGHVAARELRAVVDFGDTRRLGHAEGLKELCHRGRTARIEIGRTQYWTGRAVSASVRRMFEPVTVKASILTGSSAANAGAACGWAAGEPKTAEGRALG